MNWIIFWIEFSWNNFEDIPFLLQKVKIQRFLTNNWVSHLKRGFPYIAMSNKTFYFPGEVFLNINCTLLNSHGQPLMVWQWTLILMHLFLGTKQHNGLLIYQKGKVKHSVTISHLWCTKENDKACFFPEGFPSNCAPWDLLGLLRFPCRWQISEEGNYHSFVWKVHQWNFNSCSNYNGNW